MSVKTHRPPIRLPNGWREALRGIFQKKWKYSSEVEFLGDPPTLSRKTLDRAETSGEITPTSFDVLVRKTGYQKREQLLAALAPSTPATVSPGSKRSADGRPYPFTWLGAIRDPEAFFGREKEL